MLCHWCCVYPSIWQESQTCSLQLQMLGGMEPAPTSVLALPVLAVLSHRRCEDRTRLDNALRANGEYALHGGPWGPHNAMHFAFARPPSSRGSSLTSMVFALGQSQSNDPNPKPTTETSSNPNLNPNPNPDPNLDRQRFIIRVLTHIVML